MSFSRAKITRFNDHDPKSEKQILPSGNIKTLGKPEKSAKWVPTGTLRSATVKPLIKQRSLSQPSSSTVISKQSQRPSSGGDENNLLTNKFKKLEKFSVSEEHSDDEHFESATMIKASSDQLTKDEQNSKNANEKSEREQKTGSNSPSCKVNSSGIPLRIRQGQAAAAKDDLPSPKTASPRMVKPVSNITTLHNRTTQPISPRKSAPPSETKGGNSNIARRNLEMQFQAKKKRMDQLKREIADKQKPLVEAYQGLVLLKKKLEGSGKIIQLEELKLVDCKDVAKSSPKQSAINLTENAETLKLLKIKIDPEMVQNMKQTIKQIPATLLEICNNLLVKRSVLVDILEKMLKGSLDREELQQNVESLKEESDSLEKLVDDKFAQQEKQVTELVDKWQILLKSSGDYRTFSEQIEQLHQKLKINEQKLAEATVAHHETDQKYNESGLVAERTINDMREKIKMMESELNNERLWIQDHKDKNNLLDQKLKLLKTRIKEAEAKQKEAESKCFDLQKAHRQAQDQLKTNEHRWMKEKEEMLTKHKHDRQMLDKLTKGRSYFETRVKTLEELLEDKEDKCKLLEERTNREVEEARQAAAEDRTKRDTMQQKYDNIKDQLVQMEIRNKQAIDLVHTKNTFEPNETEGIATEREAELYTELLATRVALKAAEDQIQNYNREKLRFIDSIQLLQGDPDKDQNNVAKALIKNVEKITELEARLTESDENVCSQRIEIANLKADIENLRQRPPLPPVDAETKDGDLKLMLHEGRIKLEQSLKKSLEFEHKLIRYEHDINIQSKQICEMENLLKVRDGLISMMKAKKDELQMENDSLNKYANEIRDLLMQAKEEARNRTELVQELSTNLDSRGRVCQQLEKKVKELKGSLSATNEKRFKLQDIIGVMEKELQHTKANMNKLAPDLQSWYEPVMTTSLKTYTSNTNFFEKPNSTRKLKQEEVGVTKPTHTKTKCEGEVKSAPETQFSSPVTSQTQLSSSKNLFSKCLCNNSNIVKDNKKNELEMWMNYYHKKLKHLKRTFRSVSNTIFNNAIDFQSMVQEGIEFPNRNAPMKTPRSRYFTNLGCNINFTPKTDVLVNTKESCEGNKSKDEQLAQTYINLLNRKKSSNIVTNASLPQGSDNLLSNSETSDKRINYSLKQVQNTEGSDTIAHIKKLRNKSPTTCKSKKSPLLSSTSHRKHNLSQQIRSSYQSKKLISPRGISTAKYLNMFKPRSRPTSPYSHKNPALKKILSKSGSESSLMLIERRKLTDSTFKPNARNANSDVSNDVKTERLKFINHAHNISYHLNKNEGAVSLGKQYVPKLLSGISLYKVMPSAGSLVWCKPSTVMEVNSVLISHDLMAQSLNKINADITSSINLLSQNLPQNDDSKNHKKPTACSISYLARFKSNSKL